MPVYGRGANKNYALAQIISSFILAAAFLNPYTENAESVNAVPFMFSHYALFLSGFALSYRLAKLPPWTVIAGSLIAIFWHLPYPFAISGSVFAFRIIEEGTLILSGWLVGASIHDISSTGRSILLALWFAADTALSIVFLVAPGLYSNSTLSVSPYPPSQFVILGIAMIFFMNGVIAYLIYRYMRKYRSILLSEEL